MIRTNPTSSLDINFSSYMLRRKTSADSHLIGGVPDYAYSIDYTMRKKINAIPGMVKLAKAMLNTTVPAIKHRLSISSLKVGPSQLPDVYRMVTDCARILGIGIPSVYIESSSVINAYAYATEDEMPLIVITSALLDRLTPGELKVIIGHECGHIHNNHGIYDTAARLLIDTAGNFIPGVAQIVGLVSTPLRLALQAWSRAGEVTCDRAGVICSDNPYDALTSQGKFLYGAAFNREVNIDAVLKQYDILKSSPVRFMELDSTHPISIRRIFAIKEFMGSEILYKWRPELKEPGMTLVGKEELDMRCGKYISVVKDGKGKNNG